MNPDIQQLAQRTLAIFWEDGQTGGVLPGRFGVLVLSLGVQPTSISKQDMNDSQKYFEIPLRALDFAMFPRVNGHRQALFAGPVGLGQVVELDPCTRTSRRAGSGLAAFESVWQT